jgi:hypothetical protein
MQMGGDRTIEVMHRAVLNDLFKWVHFRIPLA